MSSVAGNFDIGELPPVHEDVEEHVILGQPVNNADAGLQSLSVELDEMTEIMKNILKVLGHAERRHMSNNILPHETIRQIQIILDSFTIWGDCTWPLRSLRDWLLT